MSSADELPIGTVTFLFTDIEGSTRLLKQLGCDRYGEALADHQRILREAFAEHGGHEIDTQGDSFFVAFRRAKDAVAAAIASQRELAEYPWPDGAHVRVRMGIHTGEPAVGGTRYVGLGVHRAARIGAAGHGGQVLVSQTARELLRDDPIPDVSLRDLGEHQLKDLDEPERLYQLAAPGLAEGFPAPKTAAPAPFEGREEALAEAAAAEMQKRWPRSGRRLLVVATLAAAAVGTAVGVLSTLGGQSTAGASIAPNAVGVIDSESGRVISEIRVGGTPAEVAVGAGAAWVTNTNDNTVSRIDPTTNDVRQTIRVGGGPASLAVGAGAVWVANGLEGNVSRIDPTTNQEVQKIEVGNGPTGVAYGEGAVWVSNSADGTVSRIAPGTSRVTKTIPAVVGASGVAVGFGRVWVVSPSTAGVVTLDPRTGTVLQRVGVGGDPSAVAVGADAVWVANRADGTVSKIDPETATVKDAIPVGSRPEGIAAGPEGIWVASAGDRTLTRLDPSNGEPVKTVTLENPPHGVALTQQGVYVAVQSTGVEHRGGTLRVEGTWEIPSLDPVVGGWDAAQVLLYTNDGLVAFRRTGGVEGTQIVPDLAVALPTPADGGKTYTFRLRPGIRYSNGDLVQPEDFKRAIERLLTIGGPDLTGYYTGILGADRCVMGKTCRLDRGIVADRSARTVTFRLTAPDGDFLAKLALPFAVAIPAGTPMHDVGSQPIPATGPYRIAALDEQGKIVRLVRNRGFREWSPDAQPQGYPDSISFSARFGLDTDARVRAVERGAADIAVGGGPPLSGGKRETLTVRSPSQLRVNPSLSVFYFFLNTQIPPFDDLRLRRAVNDAFDREEFARIHKRGVATCQILPPNLPGYHRTCPYASGGASALDAARRVVQRLGASGARVTVWSPSPAAGETRYLVSLLDSLGFRATLKTIATPDEYFPTVADPKTRAQAGFGGWAPDFPSAAGFIPLLLTCSGVGATNFAQFCDRSLDAQVSRAAAAQATDPAAATALWQQLEKSLLARSPIVPAYNEYFVSFVSKRVGNYQYHPQWGALLSQLWVQ